LVLSPGQVVEVDRGGLIENKSEASVVGSRLFRVLDSI